MDEVREVYVGQKPLHAYIAAVANLFAEGNRILRIVGRGRSIEKVVTIAQVCLNRNGTIASTLPQISQGEISIDTEVLPRQDGNTTRVSVLRIDLINSESEDISIEDE